jgi:succinate-semialdehyde dehydrogenase / glutarate-semialdehyde dehydrogenase
MYDNFGQFINGEWCTGRGTERITVIDPGKGCELGQIKAASAVDTLVALDCADRAFPGWKTHRPGNARICFRR